MNVTEKFTPSIDKGTEVNKQKKSPEQEIEQKIDDKKLVKDKVIEKNASITYKNIEKSKSEKNLDDEDRAEIQKMEERLEKLKKEHWEYTKEIKKLEWELKVLKWEVDTEKKEDNVVDDLRFSEEINEKTEIFVSDFSSQIWEELLNKENKQNTLNIIKEWFNDWLNEESILAILKQDYTTLENLAA